MGGRPISRGHLYRILSNPLYIGHIAHKGQLHPGQHEALIEGDIWAAAEAQLAANTAGHRLAPDKSRLQISFCRRAKSTGLPRPMERACCRSPAAGLNLGSHSL